MVSRYARARAFKFVRRTAGDLVLAVSANWADVTAADDATLAAAVGDVIEVELNGYLSNTAGAGVLDAVTMVGGAPVNSFAGGGPVTAAPPPYGVQGWTLIPNINQTVTGSAFYTVVAGDLASGYVTVRLRYFLAGAGRTLYSNANNPLFIMVRNLGPADPN